MDGAYRLTFEYDGTTLSLKSMRHLEMRVPAGQPAEDFTANESGQFVELRDGAGDPLYRSAIIAGLSPTMEYPTGDPDRPFGQADISGMKRTVSVLVPAEDQAQSVALVEVGLPTGFDTAEAGEPESRDLISVNILDLMEPG